jgi:hypothetical protein
MDIDDDYHSIANDKEPALSVKDIAIQIFVQKYSFNLLAGAVEWLQELAEEFEISDIQEARDTFDHIALACRGAAGKQYFRNSNYLLLTRPPGP